MKMKNVRSRDEIIKGLLTRAFNRAGEAGKAEMQVEIDRRLKRVRDGVTAVHKGMLKMARQEDQWGNPQSIRKLNMKRHAEGEEPLVMTENMKALQQKASAEPAEQPKPTQAPKGPF
jgi:hypothetical protein